VGDVGEGLVSGVLAYLGAINILIAAFNLIPAAPLDGGRILCAVLWAWRGDRTQAQVWSARAGRVFGLGMIALGLFTLFTEWGDGLWWILVGLFIVTMASAEEDHARKGAIRGSLLVREIMTPDPHTADPQQTVAEFVRDVAMTHRHSAYPLLDPTGGVQGMVTLNRARALPRDHYGDTTVGDIACPPDKIPMVGPDELVSDLMVRLGSSPDGRALVMRHGRLIGIISPSDISRAISLRGLGDDSIAGTGGTRSR
jgi:CBS domain-containing protein